MENVDVGDATEDDSNGAVIQKVMAEAGYETRHQSKSRYGNGSNTMVMLWSSFLSTSYLFIATKNNSGVTIYADM